MSGWMEVVLRAALRYARGVMRDALAEVTAPDVAGAKAEVEAFIQRRKRLPGTVRRWLCHDVRRIQAATVEEFRAKLEAGINRLG